MSTGTQPIPHEEEIRQLLEPGERLLTLSSFRQADGKQQMEDPPDPPDDRSGLQKAGLAALGVAALAVDGPSPPSLARMLGGVSVGGHAGSWAYRLREAYLGTLRRSNSTSLTGACC
jgi:hypothetical protein